MLEQQNFDRIRKYWQAFWAQDLIDRPPVCVTAPRSGVERPACNLTPAAAYHACLNADLGHLQAFEQLIASIYYGGEALPKYEVTVGPDLYAAFLGAKIEAGAETTWSHPIVRDWSEFAVRIDQSPGSYFDQVKAFMTRAAAFGAGKFLVNMLDLHSNLDALSALRGPQDLCLDLMDCPEEVHRVLNEVRRTYPTIFEMAYQAGDMAARGSIGWAPTYCEGRFAVVQCDFSCLISPAQAREFVIPAVAEEAAYLDHCVYHYDGPGALGHLDDILAIPDIDCLQWVPGDGQPRSLEWMDLLHKIQRAGKSLWIYDWTIDEIKQHHRELEPNKVAYSVSAASVDEAEDLLDYLARNS